MALKALLIKKRLDERRKALEALQAKDADFNAREAELTASINEVDENTAPETRDDLDELITAFEGDKKAHEEAKTALRDEIAGLESELADEEAKQNTEPPAEDKPAEHNERKENAIMTTRTKIFSSLSVADRDAMFAREDVKTYLANVRTCIQEKRALTNVGLTIPTVFLGLLRENIMNYSKLYRHVSVRPVAGEARAVIMGAIPEAVWTDCCANLNELSLGFNDMELGCWKVAGYFAVCNANIEDSDLDLAAELLTAIGQAIGYALDKAILYGTGNRMPLGIVTRLAQTDAPAGYPATARAWDDLHESNILSIEAANGDADLFRYIVLDAGAAKGKYSRGEKVWVMNETTYTFLIANALTINANGAIVAGVDGTMPVVGGAIEVLDFVPDNVIIGGYFDLYILAERSGAKFATSEHVRFLQDQTVMKGVARYDGAPAIPEAFVVIGLNGVTPDATMTFAADTANEGA